MLNSVGVFFVLHLSQHAEVGWLDVPTSATRAISDTERSQQPLSFKQVKMAMMKSCCRGMKICV